MTLKNAALLALVGMALQTIVVVAGFIVDVTGVLRGVVADKTLVTSLVSVLANLSLVVFLYVFHKAQL
jgi:hypothetical protein